MALFRLPTTTAPALAPRGHGLLLRAPQMPDYVQWSELREMSRLFLTPWEPIWPSDDLTRSGFRRPTGAATPKISPRTGPIRSWCFARATARSSAGVTLANVRRGIVQAGTLGYWVGQHMPQGLHDGGAPGCCCRLCSASSTCTASRLPASPPTSPRSGCWRSAALPARAWRGVICVSTGSGRTITCMGCWTRISAVNQPV